MDHLLAKRPQPALPDSEANIFESPLGMPEGAAAAMGRRTAPNSRLREEPRSLTLVYGPVQQILMPGHRRAQTTRVRCEDVMEDIVYQPSQVIDSKGFRLFGQHGQVLDWEELRLRKGKERFGNWRFAFGSGWGWARQLKRSSYSGRHCHLHYFNPATKGWDNGAWI